MTKVLACGGRRKAKTKKMKTECQKKRKITWQKEKKRWMGEKIYKKSKKNA